MYFFLILCLVHCGFILSSHIYFPLIMLWIPYFSLMCHWLQYIEAILHVIQKRKVREAKDTQLYLSLSKRKYSPLQLTKEIFVLPKVQPWCIKKSGFFNIFFLFFSFNIFLESMSYILSTFKIIKSIYKKKSITGMRSLNLNTKFSSNVTSYWLSSQRSRNDGCSLLLL